MIRMIDFVLALCGIVILSPVFLMIYIIGIFDTGSPLFFQKRVGKGQRVFTLIKFRTMPVGTDSVATHLVGADRVTRVGRFLRKTKLDELPQLINVIVGDMSLVGPRPCLVNQYELITERALRGVFNVRPGITGLAQINEVDMSTPKKLAKLDRLMIDTMNLRRYLIFFIRTIFGDGAGDRV
ncbi:MAG: putative sugar transferase EpsL [Candidatus Celerinatantimonas neptuna]|nr:MAG: putative sugar transferase EpsL [Candidatus Celerinatantimonas neptuna]